MATGGAQYSESHLEGMLECCVCLDTVNDPHTLQRCLHTVCKTCMQKMKAEQDNHPPGVNCPICRTFSGEDMISSNFFIKELTEMHTSVKEQKRIVCRLCYDDNQQLVTATCRCVDCKAHLCESCTRAHRKFPHLKGHKIVGLTEEWIIDEHVTCPEHNDKHIELFCIPCQSPVCITCTVTTHHGHQCQTVEKALAQIIPEIEKDTAFIEENIAQIVKSVEDVEAKIAEMTSAFEKCLIDVDKLAEERKGDIEENRIQIKHQIEAKKSKEISKLVNIKEKLERKKKERTNLKDVTKISLRHAQHATLLNEVIQSGIQGKIQAVKDEKEAPEKLKVEHPKLNTQNTDWKSTKEKSLGEIEYYGINMFVSFTHGVTGFGSRYWDVNFKEYFAQQFNPKSVEITGKSGSQLKWIHGRIWATRGGNINIFDINGKLLNTITMKVPPIRSVTLADNGDIFVGFDHDGLHVITGDDPSLKISDGRYSEVSSYRSKVYAMEFEKRIIQEYLLDKNSDDVKFRWKPGKELKLEYAVDLKHDGGAKNFIVSGSNEDLQFYISLYNDHKILQYNYEGECVRTFGSRDKVDGDLLYPRLVGIDNQSNLLVADQNHYVYKILDTGTGQWTTTGVKGESCVYDAVLDDDNNLWLCHYNNNIKECIVTKHIPK